MDNKYSKENVNIGDRVLLEGGQLEEGKHWGKVAEHTEPHGVMVVLDNPEVYGNDSYQTVDGRDCYYAYWSEIRDLVKVGGLPEAERELTLEIEVVTEPDPLSTVVEDLMATHRYLEQVTGKKYRALVQGVALDTGNGYDSNEVTIKFVLEESN